MSKDYGPPLQRGQAEYLLTHRLKQIKLQAPRVEAVRVTEDDASLRTYLAELGLLLDAVGGFLKVLKRFSLSGHPYSEELQTIYEEFEGSEGLKQARDVMAHAEEWVRGHGQTRGGQPPGLLHSFTFLVSRGTNQVIATGLNLNSGKLIFSAAGIAQVAEAAYWRTSEVSKSPSDDSAPAD